MGRCFDEWCVLEGWAAAFNLRGLQRRSKNSGIEGMEPVSFGLNKLILLRPNFPSPIVANEKAVDSVRDDRPKQHVERTLDKHPAAPFLFVGSGFSRRYLGLEDWAGLLARFCAPIREFGYYSSKGNGALPLAASYMAQDFNEWWWAAPETAESRKAFAADVKTQSDALKFEIAKYMASFSLENARESEFGNEFLEFSEVAVDGIITTNWDYLLEELFPDYKVFVGQGELLFSNPQAIGEIYKIHGSAADPKSLVLTDEDYAEFSSKNPYLAAKLVTIFVEHPIVFLGYSITDPHIRAIITSIAQCLTQDKIAAFQENLIFVQRVSDGEAPSIEKTAIQSGAFSVTMMVAKISSYSQVYWSF
jgi:hypothetical protein